MLRTWFKRLLQSPRPSFAAKSRRTTYTPWLEALEDRLAPANVWFSTGSLGTARIGATATLLGNDQVLVAGGTDNNGHFFASAELYNPSTNQWSPTSNLNVARSGATATLLNNGTVLVAGGLGAGAAASAELYNPATGTWSATGSLNVGRIEDTATLLSSGQVLVAGGISPFGGNQFASAELYNPATGAWTIAASLSTARDSATATLLSNGKVLVVGGESNLVSGLAVLNGEIYNPITATWSAAGVLSSNHIGATATLLANGNVLVASGGFGNNLSSEFYNPTLNQWASAGPMNSTHAYASAVLLNDGNVLVAGGQNGSATPQAAAEQYNPVTGVWSTAGNMHAARALATATLLRSGQVLLAGGTSLNINATGGALSSSELFGIINTTNASPIYGSAFSTTVVAWTDSPPPSTTFTATGLPAWANFNSATGVLSGTPTGVVDSTITVTASNGVTPNAIGYFTLSVQKAPLTITAVNQGRFYGNADPTFTATFSGFVNGDSAANLQGSLSFSHGDSASSVPGTFEIVPGGVTSSNYAITIVAGTLTVSPQPLTIKADDQSKTYGASNPSLTVSYTGFVLGQGPANLSGDLTVTTSAATGSPVGAYPIAVSGATGTASNYAITFVSGTLTVAPASLTALVGGRYRVYGQANPTFSTASYIGFVNGDTAAVVTGALSLSTTATASSGTGTYPIVANGISAANYNISVEGSLTITPATLIVSANPQVMFHGQSVPTLTASYSGFVNSDSPNNMEGTLSFTTTATNISPAGAYPIIAGGLSSANYNVTFLAGLLLVLKADNALSFAPMRAVPLGAGPVTLNAIGGGSSSPVVYRVLFGPGTITGNQLTPTGLGTVLIEATQAGDANYQTAIPTFLAVTVETAQKITFTQPVSPVAYTATPITLSAAATSTLAIAFSVVSGPGTISGNKLTVTGVGTIVIQADQAGNATFAPAAPAQRTLVVNKANQAITFNPLTTVPFSSAPINLTATASSRLPIAYTVVSGPGAITAGNQLTITGVGSIVLNANQPGNDNYNAATQIARTLVVIKANQAITFGALAPVTYGVRPITLGATANSGLTVSYKVISGHGTINGNQLTVTGAGAIVVQATQAGNANFNAAAFVMQTLIVNQATLTVAAADTTWIARLPGQRLAGFTITGFVGEDTQTTLFGAEAALVTCITVNASNPQAGIYTILVSKGSLVASANYKFVFRPGTLTVR